MNKKAQLLAGIVLLSLLLSLAQTGRATTADPQPQSVSSLIFKLERVDAPPLYRWMGSRSLRLDASGQPRIAYGADHLYYAKRVGGFWSTEVVDSEFGVGMFASLALDSSGNPHIAYYDAVNGALRYAAFNGSNWTRTTVDSRPAAAEASLPGPALPPDLEAEESLPAIASPLRDLPFDEASLEDQTAGVGTLPDDSQNVDALPAAPDAAEEPPVPALGVGMYPSIALDASGNPAISYYDGVNGALKLARRSGTAWEIRTVDNTGDTGLYSALAVDSAGALHVSYYDLTNGFLRYGRYNGASWSLLTVDNTPDTGRFTSITVDSARSAHISYYNVTLGDLWYAKVTSASVITKSPVATADNSGMYSSIFLLPGSPDKLYISYSHLGAAGDSLRFVEWNGSGWVSRSVIGTLESRYTSVTATSGGVQISFYDSNTGALRYAEIVGSSAAVTGIGDPAGEVGKWVSLAKDSSGNLHAAYYNEIRDELRYARWTGTAWQVRKVTVGCQCGYGASLAIAPDGSPRISFYDATNDAVKYALWNGANWQISEIEKPIGGLDEIGRGLTTSLALDASGNPLVAYFKGSTNKAILAKLVGVDWVKTDLRPSSTDVGRFIAIQMESGGFLHVVYQEVIGPSSKYLRYLKLNSSGAIVGGPTDLDTIGEAGFFNSLKLDSAGNPRVAYFNDNGDSLKFVGYNGSAWSSPVVVATAAWYPSLSVAPDGTPYITYYPVHEKHLKLAVGTTGGWVLQDVDTRGDVGISSSSVTGANGLPQIAYADLTSGDLKVATTLSFTLLEQLYLPFMRR